MPPMRKGYSPKGRVLAACPKAYAVTVRVPPEPGGPQYLSFHERVVYESRGGRVLGREAVGIKAWEAALALLIAEGRATPHVPIRMPESGLVTMMGDLTFTYAFDD